MALYFPRKKKDEKEGHFYICEKCGCFYKIIENKQIRLSMKDINKIGANNFHLASNHNCIKIKIEGKKHNALKKPKKIKKIRGEIIYSNKNLKKIKE